MNRSTYLSAAILLIGACLLAGCRPNANVRKQKYMESGDRFSADGKYREAAIQYLNALKVDGENPAAHYALARTYGHLRQFNDARLQLARTVELQPGNLQARVDYGNLLFASGRVDEAKEQANTVLAERPADPGVHALLSAIALREGQREAALNEIHRALELDPNRAAFHDDLAMIEAGASTGNGLVEEELKKAIALDPKSVNAKLLLVAFYSRNDRLQDAEKAGWDAMATDPGNLPARASVAQVIFKRGDAARAEQVLSQASKDLAGNTQGVRLLADYYVASGQLDKARAEYASLVVRYPNNLALRKGYIRVLLRVKDQAAARILVAGLMKTDPRDPEVAALNGILLLIQCDTNDGANLLLNSAGSFQEDDFILYWIGKAWLAKGDIGLAERSFGQAAELNPSATDAQEELAQIAVQRGDLRLLCDVADSTIGAAPNFADGYVWRAVVEMSRNASNLAEADLKTALMVDSQNPKAFLQLGKLRFAQKRFAEGAVNLERALRYNPNSVEAMRLLIGYDLYRHQPDKALARLNAQIEANPRNSCFYVLLAQLQIQVNQLDQAAATAEKAIQLNSSDGEAVRLFAQIALQRGQTANVIAAWQQRSNAHPKDADALTILGTLEESCGDMEKAESYYKQSLQIEPRQPVAANNLAYRMLMNGDMPNEALTLAQTARQGMPDSPNTADTLAWAYYVNGAYEFSRDLLEDAVGANPGSATMQYHLGMVYSKLRDKNDAAIHLKKAMSLARDSQTAKNARTALQGLG